jgi:hypothetical protein
MKHNDILTEQQLDELNWQDVKSGAAKGLGAIGRGVGAVAGIPKGMANAAKKGYNASVQAIGGPDETPQDSQAVDAQSIQQQIDTKKSEIQQLQQQLNQLNQNPDQTAGTQPGTSKLSNATKALTKGIAGAGNVIDRGTQGLASAGQSQYLRNKQLARGNEPASQVTVKDPNGVAHNYTKRGNQWYDEKNQPVPSAMNTMLDQQAQPSRTNQAARVGIPPGPSAALGPNAAPTFQRVADTGEKAEVPARTPGAMGIPPGPSATRNMPTPAAATPNYGTRQSGYQQANYNAPTGVPAIGGKLPQASPTMPQGQAQPQSQPTKQPKVTSGGPTPAEKANLEKRIQTAAQQTVAESSDFGAKIWRQMKEPK